jgi:hypothetical protein
MSYKILFILHKSLKQLMNPKKVISLEKIFEFTANLLRNISEFES